MTPGEVERAYEDIKRHLGQAQQHKQAGADDLMRAEAEAAAALFQPVLTEAGDLLGMLDVLRAALLSFGYSEEECNTLLSQSRSPGSMKKPRRAGSAKIPAKAPRPEPLPESESINLHDAPDFFNRKGRRLFVNKRNGWTTNLG